MSMALSVPVSMLDLATVGPEESFADALAASVDLARLAEELGYTRVWYAEHHNMPSIASSATSVLIAHVAAHTSSIRLGAGGVMLPNHSPLVIAEHYGTLATLHPDRIDLGLGRAPGTDPTTMRALRRDATSADTFPQDVVELQGYLRGESLLPNVNAYPGAGTDVPLFILGSSLFGATLAARLGLPYAFASHFAPAALEQACAQYRAEFQPSEQLAEPYLITAMNVVADESEAAAARQVEDVLRARVSLVLPPGTTITDEQADEILASPHGDRLRQMMSCTALGTGEQAAAQVAAFAERTGADEVIVSHPSLSAADRTRSVRLLGEQLR